MDNVQTFGLLGIVAIFALGYFVYRSKKKSSGTGTGTGGGRSGTLSPNQQEK